MLWGKVKNKNTGEFLKDSHINNVLSIIILKLENITISSFLKLRMQRLKIWEKQFITMTKHNSKSKL